MPAPSDEPLARCDLNLYAKDKSWLYRRYGNGWSSTVRNLVRKHIREIEARETEPMTRIIKQGDFP